MNWENLITIFILALVVILVASKGLSGLLQGLYDYIFNPKVKKKDQDIDALIEAEKLRLKTRNIKNVVNPDNPQGQQERKSLPPARSQTEKKYLEILQSNSSNQEAKLILMLIEKTSWADGPAYRKIQKDLDLIDAELGNIGKMINFLHHKEILINPTPWSYKKILTYARSYFICKKLWERTQELPAQSFLDVKCEDIVYEKAVSFLFLSQDDFSLALLSQISKRNDPLELLKSFKPETVHFYLMQEEKFNLDKLKKNLTELVNLFNILTPLPLPPKDINKKKKWALEVFSLEPGYSRSELKKKYHQLAKENHPDRISSLSNHKKFEELAEKNFQFLQMAYELLSES